MNTSSEMTYKRNDRERNWENFFTKDSYGITLLNCLSSNIRLKEWSTPAGAAKQVSSIYRSSSLNYHSTHLSIVDNEEISTVGISQVTIQYQLISCVAKTFNLELT
jgi:hypothetical protein